MLKRYTSSCAMQRLPCVRERTELEGACMWLNCRSLLSESQAVQRQSAT